MNEWLLIFIGKNDAGKLFKSHIPQQMYGMSCCYYLHGLQHIFAAGESKELFLGDYYGGKETPGYDFPRAKDSRNVSLQRGNSAGLSVRGLLSSENLHLMEPGFHFWNPASTCLLFPCLPPPFLCLLLLTSSSFTIKCMHAYKPYYYWNIRLFISLRLAPASPVHVFWRPGGSGIWHWVRRKLQLTSVTPSFKFPHQGNFPPLTAQFFSIYQAHSANIHPSQLWSVWCFPHCTYIHTDNLNLKRDDS